MAKDIETAPNPIDIHVGLRIRLRRKELGVSQEKLAEAIGLSPSWEGLVAQAMVLAGAALVLAWPKRLPVAGHAAAE